VEGYWFEYEVRRRSFATNKAQTKTSQSFFVPDQMNRTEPNYTNLNINLNLKRIGPVESHDRGKNRTEQGTLSWTAHQRSNVRPHKPIVLTLTTHIYLITSRLSCTSTFVEEDLHTKESAQPHTASQITSAHVQARMYVRTYVRTYLRRSASDGKMRL
jgi:hypothetical protein